MLLAIEQGNTNSLTAITTVVATGGVASLFHDATKR
jgi:aspartate oxidase